ELGNPLVAKYLDFYPEDAAGQNIFKLSQSEKWLHQFPRDLQAQTISHGGKHFYIYEPVQINNGNVVVPIYFYTKKNKLFSKVSRLHVEVSYNMDVEISIHGELDFHSSCLKEIPTEEFWKPYNEIHKYPKKPNIMFFFIKLNTVITEKGSEQISLPNQWRIKADGKLIRHIPLNLYSDDTSGNISKQWNKHISIFMTLSGLLTAFGISHYAYFITYFILLNKFLIKDFYSMID
ncbi:hypothetical protein BY996DRAFT_4602884, partial [Phakopsora pachyrhizi]